MLSWKSSLEISKTHLRWEPPRLLQGMSFGASRTDQPRAPHVPFDPRSLETQRQRSPSAQPPAKPSAWPGSDPAPRGREPRSGPQEKTGYLLLFVLKALELHLAI